MALLSASHVKRPAQEVYHVSTLVVAILLLGSLVTSCMQLDGKKNEARISNESGVALEVFWTAPGADDLPYANIAAGQVHGLFE